MSTTAFDVQTRTSKDSNGAVSRSHSEWTAPADDRVCVTPDRANRPLDPCRPQAYRASGGHGMWTTRAGGSGAENRDKKSASGMAPTCQVRVRVEEWAWMIWVRTSTRLRAR